MNFFQAFLLGAIQGITEFLPISSSGHLILLESLFGLEIESLKGFDVAVHLGSLLAIIIYFWSDIWSLRKNLKLASYLGFATIPAVIAGLTLEDWLDTVFRDPRRVILMLFILALFFLGAERWPRQKNSTQFTFKNTFIMGLAQACALIPGISRSGSIMATGLFQGLKREEGAKFAFLLGIPAIAGASLLTGLKVYNGEATLPEWPIVLTGFVTSAVIGYFSVAFLMRFLKTHSLRVFAWYLLMICSVTFVYSLIN